MIKFDNNCTSFSRSLLNLARHLYSEDYDCVITNHDSLLAIPAVISAQSNNTSLIIQIGGDSWETNDDILTEAINQRNFLLYLKMKVLIKSRDYILPFADGYIALSSHLGSIIEEKALTDKNNICVLPTPFQTNEYYHNITTNKIVTISNLDFEGKYRAIKDGLTTIKSVMDDKEDVEYIIAGGGKYEGKLSRNINNLKDYYKDRICYLGEVDDVKSLYKNCSVFFYPSYVDGYPTVVLEAQSHGIPVVTIDSQGMTDQIIDGESGLFIDSPDKGANVIKRLLTDDDLHEMIGKGGYERLMLENDPSFLSNKLWSFVSSI